jgi:hypothetical protein
MARRRKHDPWSAVWRVRPAPSVAHAVEGVAKREGQSIAAVIERLVVEALQARIAAVEARAASTPR